MLGLGPVLASGDQLCQQCVMAGLFGLCGSGITLSPGESTLTLMRRRLTRQNGGCRHSHTSHTHPTFLPSHKAHITHTHVTHTHTHTHTKHTSHTHTHTHTHPQPRREKVDGEAKQSHETKTEERRSSSPPVARRYLPPPPLPSCVTVFPLCV